MSSNIGVQITSIRPIMSEMMITERSSKFGYQNKLSLLQQSLMI